MRSPLAALALGLACAPALAQSPSAPASGVSIRRGEAATRSIGVGEVGYLSPRGADTVGQMLLVEAPGYRTPVHVHHRTDETFYVLSGQLTLWVEGRFHELNPGDYVFIPRGTPHAQGNRGAEPTRLLLTVSPGAFVEFFRARESIILTAPPGHPDYGPRMEALGERFDIQNVARSPF